MTDGRAARARVRSGQAVRGASEEEATQLVENLDMAFTLDRLNTWPPRAVG